MNVQRMINSLAMCMEQVKSNHFPFLYNSEHLSFVMLKFHLLLQFFCSSLFRYVRWFVLIICVSHDRFHSLLFLVWFSVSLSSSAISCSILLSSTTILIWNVLVKMFPFYYPTSKVLFNYVENSYFYFIRRNYTSMYIYDNKFWLWHGIMF